ncbi:hypothetical protein [Gemella sp.]
MKKLIKLDFDNTTRERKTEDSYSELYSYDKNNGSFEFEILNDTLTTEQVIALFKFTESNKIWKTTGTVEGNKVHVTFDTTLITQNETVICYLYFDEEQRTSDTFRFKFKVKVSEIDKMNRYEVKERFINNTVIVDRLDVVTKDELKEALKNVGGIATEGLLTEVKAEETYAKKTEAVDNTNFELVKNRVLALELKTDKDTVYDDTNVRERLTALESKPNIDVSTLATKEELEAVRGSQPSIDNLVTKDELASKNYLTEHQNLDEYSKKSEIPQEYNDTEVKERLTNLENKASLDLSNLATKQELNEVRNSQPTVDTSNLVTKDELTAKNYLTEHQSLENLVTKQELENKGYITTHQDISGLVSKDELQAKNYISDISNLVTKEELASKNYLTEHIKERLTALENKPNVDLSNYITSEQLENKHYLTQHQPLDNLVTKEELNSKGYVTDEVLNSKGYLTEHQPLTEYALKSELYNDAEVKQRLTILENKPNIDTSNFVTNEQLEAKHYLTEHQPLSHLATTSDLEVLRNVSVSKSELSKKLDITEYNTFRDIVVTKDELNSKGYLTEHQDISNLATKQDVEDTYAKKSELPTPYNDSALVSRINVLEAKTDNDTVYNDTEVKQRLTALESRPSSQSEMRGTGMPNGVVEAPIGATYIDTAKTNGALKWIKTTDGGNTGWKVVEGDTGWLTVFKKDERYNKNTLKIRRVNNVVNVMFYNDFPEDDSILFGNKNNEEENLATVEISSGFKPETEILLPALNNFQDIVLTLLVVGACRFDIVDNVLKVDLATNENASVITSGINKLNFTYSTYDEWPTELPTI